MHPGPILGVKDKDPKYDYDKNPSEEKAESYNYYQ